jgi:hypothetical protein
VASPYVLLQQLTAAEETGVLFVVMQDGHQMRVGLGAGKIVHVSYAMRRGIEAVGRARSTAATAANFVRGMQVDAQPDLPGRDQLMDLLRTPLSTGMAADNDPPPPTPPPATLRQGRTTTLPPGGTATESRLAASVEELRELLVDYIGPIGELLLEQELAHGRSWSELVERLAREISPPAAAQGFRTAALRIPGRR